MAYFGQHPDTTESGAAGQAVLEGLGLAITVGTTFSENMTKLKSFTSGSIPSESELDRGDSWSLWRDRFLDYFEAQITGLLIYPETEAMIARARGSKKPFESDARLIAHCMALQAN